MKKLFVILTISLFSCAAVYCQLLSHPDLSVADIELAISNPDHLKGILREHGFAYDPGIGNTNPGYIKNPLMPDAETSRTEFWRPELNDSTWFLEIGSQIVRYVSFYDWKADKGPYPGVYQTIMFMINSDPKFAETVDTFFRTLKDQYPVKAERTAGNSELLHIYKEPIKVFVNGISKVEIKMDQAQAGDPKGKVRNYYLVSFNAIR